MKLRRHQIQVILLLNFVLVILFVGIISMFYFNTTTAASNPPAPHEIKRDARVSLSPHLSWETNFGGSEAESLVALFSHNEHIYIFGNTTSTDLDFISGAGGFMAVLSDKGATEEFFTYPGEIIKVVQTNKGFILGMNNDGAALKMIDYAGTSTLDYKVESAQKENLLDLKVFGAEIHMVMNSINGSTSVMLTKVVIVDLEFKVKFTLIFPRSFTLDYITILPKGNNYVLIANIKGISSNYLTFAVYDVKGEMNFFNVEMDIPYHTFDIVPYSNGYAAIIKDTTTDILTISNTFEKRSRIYLNSVNASKANFMYDGKNLSVFSVSSGDSSSLKMLSPELDTKGSIPEFNNLSCIFDFYAASESTYYIGKSAASLTLICKSIDEPYNITKKSIGSMMENNALILPGKNGTYIAATSRGKSQDVGDNFGANDIWLTFAPFEK